MTARILMVEDVEDNRVLASFLLTAAGHAVVEATSGAEALAKAAAADFDVVLMDLSLPEMDGFATLAALRRLPRAQRVPVVAVTAHAMAGDRERAIAAGFVGYIAKPLDVGRFASQVGVFL